MVRTSTTLNDVDRRLDAAILDTNVTGFGIVETATFRSVLFDSSSVDDISLLVFLRHFG